MNTYVFFTLRQPHPENSRAYSRDLQREDRNAPTNTTMSVHNGDTDDNSGPLFSLSSSEEICIASVRKDCNRKTSALWNHIANHDLLSSH